MTAVRTSQTCSSCNKDRGEPPGPPACCVKESHDSRRYRNDSEWKTKMLIKFRILVFIVFLCSSLKEKRKRVEPITLHFPICLTSATPPLIIKNVIFFLHLFDALTKSDWLPNRS